LKTKANSFIRISAIVNKTKKENGNQREEERWQSKRNKEQAIVIGNSAITNQ
jgi:hypothetical protein